MEIYDSSNRGPLGTFRRLKQNYMVIDDVQFLTNSVREILEKMVKSTRLLNLMIQIANVIIMLNLNT